MSAKQSSRHSRPSTIARVYTTLGVTLEQIAALRATRNNPRYSVMFVDDVGVAMGKKRRADGEAANRRNPQYEAAVKTLCVL
jgi:putative spermidine/putrescine transport system substrate-binding protein